MHVCYNVCYNTVILFSAAVRRNATTKSATDNDIKEYAANWLKYANKRQKSKVKETNRMVEDDVVDGELDENEDLLD